ncbi:MAG: Gfo/Idh/MocA family oxidoreductase [Clostridia bacterium]|nr:Gfo/Idh/MocA family oxidoreductase [Clostridia bacterium]
MKKLRVGIIGCGMALEKLHYPAYVELADKYQIAALCDADRQKAENWAAKLGLAGENIYTDYKQMIQQQDLDCFDIMVPIELNFEVLEAVAKAGKPVIAEKPLAPTPEQAEACKELPKKYKIPIMIAENYRYNEEIDMIRDMLRTEKVGKPLYFMWNRVMFFPGDMIKNSFSAKEWRQHPEFPGGIILDTGVHDMAALHHIFGPVDKVQAFGVPQDDDFAPYSVVNANFRFQNGVIGQYAFFGSGKEMQRPLVGLRIFCSEGMIFLEERDCGTINVAHNEGWSEQIPYRPQRGYYNELLNFYKATIGQESIAVTPEMEFGDTMLIFDILKSIREEEIVSVNRDKFFIPSHQIPQGVHQYPHA